MYNKISILHFVFIVVSIKSQEYDRYNFEKYVKYVFNDSSYTTMGVALNHYLVNQPYYEKYLEKEIIPLKFMIRKNEKDSIKFDFDEIETFSTFTKGMIQSNPSICFDFSTLITPSTALEKRSGADYYFTSYTNDVDINFKKNINGSNKIEYKLKTFSIEKISTPYDQSILISKKFSSKSHVFTHIFLNNCEKCDVEKIIYSNKTTILSKNRKENNLRFSVIIYELVEKNNDQEPLLISRNIDIVGDKNEAMKYLKKNKLDYQNVFPEKINKEDFNDLD